MQRAFPYAVWVSLLMYIHRNVWQTYIRISVRSITRMCMFDQGLTQGIREGLRALTLGL